MIDYLLQNQKKYCERMGFAFVAKPSCNHDAQLIRGGVSHTFSHMLNELYDVKATVMSVTHHFKSCPFCGKKYDT